MAKIEVLEAKKVINNGLIPTKNGDYSVFEKAKGRDFRILQLTDLHFGRDFKTKKKDKLAHNAVVTLVERTKPDLIIITGDNVYPMPIVGGTLNNLKASKYVGQLMESFEIPWTMTFGNHDYEPICRHTKDELLSYYASLPHCLLKNSDLAVQNKVFGVGNHIINIENEAKKVLMSLVMIDSNMYIGKTFFSTFDTIHDDQIQWYKDSITDISKNGATSKVPSLAFFHIPVKEYQEAWGKLKMGKLDEVTYHCGTINEINDHVGFARRKEGHFFEEMVKFGSCKGMFCGHDHLNNISMTYKGIRLTYGMAIDFLAYIKIKKKYTNRGATLITIDDEAKFNVELVPLTTAIEIYE